jgi:hypothetical protein
MQSKKDVRGAALRATSLLEYLSPFGVISTTEFVYRLLSFVGFLLLAVMSLAWLSSLETYLEKIGLHQPASFVYPVAGVFGFLLFWFLLSTLTKEYRTAGMPIPFIFALLTKVLPFIFIFRFLLSSKTKRAVNTERANRQAEYRKSEKKQPKKRKIADVD